MAVAMLTQYRDFRGMCRQPDVYKTTICELNEARFLVENNGEQFQFILTADRFLRGMVRMLVGQILEVGYGRETLEQFEHYLKTGEAPRFPKLAYPQGLYLSGVRYRYINEGDKSVGKVKS